jgi:hypothetical protein
MDRSRKTILIVDDDERIRTALESGLTLSGYDAVPQGNGRLGLAWLDEHRPDLIIVDVVMPEVDGLRFIGELQRRGLHPGVPTSSSRSLCNWRPSSEKPRAYSGASAPHACRLPETGSGQETPDELVRADQSGTDVPPITGHLQLLRLAAVRHTEVGNDAIRPAREARHDCGDIGTPPT